MSITTITRRSGRARKSCRPAVRNFRAAPIGVDEAAHGPIDDWTLGVTVVLGLGISAIATAETRRTGPRCRPGAAAGFDPISTSLIGVFIAQFAIGVLGALAMSAEYGTGTIRATFSAAPRRPLVLVAKAAVFGVVALVVVEVVAFLAFFLGQALLSAPATHATLGSPGALRAVAGAGYTSVCSGCSRSASRRSSGTQRGPSAPLSGSFSCCPYRAGSALLDLARREALPAGPYRGRDDLPQGIRERSRRGSASSYCAATQRRRLGSGPTCS